MAEPPARESADDGRVGARTRMECGVCWHVYDPGLGDPVWRVPPGTPFPELPAHWSCPNCAALRDQFIVLDDNGSPR